MLRAIEKHPHVMEPAFIASQVKLDAGIIEAMFDVRYSETGSNRHQREIVTISYWRDLLQDLEGTALSVHYRACQECVCEVILRHFYNLLVVVCF